MATIRELLTNRTIHFVQPNQTVLEAADYMVSCNVGGFQHGLVGLDEMDGPVGQQFADR